MLRMPFIHWQIRSAFNPDAYGVGGAIDATIWKYLPMITTKAQEALGKEVIHVDNANIDHLNFYPAKGIYDLFTPSQSLAPVRIRKGCIT